MLFSPLKWSTLILTFILTSLSVAFKAPAQAQNLRYIEVGNSDFYGDTAYVDKQSIEAIDNSNSYTYTLVVGLAERKSESDVQVDCSEIGSIYLEEMRYFDEQGNLYETESINVEKQVNPVGPIYYYQANQTVCELMDATNLSS